VIPHFPKVSRRTNWNFQSWLAVRTGYAFFAVATTKLPRENAFPPGGTPPGKRIRPNLQIVFENWQVQASDLIR
jgi:hypothetical protein